MKVFFKGIFKANMNFSKVHDTSKIEKGVIWKPKYIN
jgi:hypothetical protein